MTSSKQEMKPVHVLDSDWFKTDHRAVLAVLSMKPKMRYTMRNVRTCVAGSQTIVAQSGPESLTEWENWNAMMPLLIETARTHRRMESKELSVTELELKSLLLRKKKVGDNSEGQS